jgi:hypothetical protein
VAGLRVPRLRNAGGKRGGAELCPNVESRPTVPGGLRSPLT